MKAFSFRSRILLPLLIGLAVIAACDKPRSTGGDTDPEVPTGPTLDEDGLRALLMKGYRLYWKLPELGTGERTTIGTQAMMKLDPAKAPSLKALRSLLAPAFTSAAIDSVFADFGVRERGGALWMFADAGSDDVSNYEEAEVLDLEADSAQATADIEVPLGDSGQTDERSVRAVRSGTTWKLASNPFSPDGDGGEEGDSTEAP